MHVHVYVCMCVLMCTCVCMCSYVYVCVSMSLCRPVATYIHIHTWSGNRGVRKTNVDLTSGRWLRWVARYEKGGWAVHFRADIRKVGGGGGGGGGGAVGNSLQVHYEKWGGGNSQKLHKPGPAPHKRTLTLLGGVRSNPPNPPWLRA